MPLAKGSMNHAVDVGNSEAFPGRAFSSKVPLATPLFAIIIKIKSNRKPT